MDYRIFRVLHGLAAHGHLADSVVRFFASDAVLVFPAVLVLLWIFPGRGRRGHAVRTALVVAAMAALLALGLDQVINHAVNRPRPYVAHHLTVPVLLAKSKDNSFPSDHTAFAFAVAAGVFLGRRWVGALLGVLGVVVGLARVVAGMHYPGDVLGGALVGIASAAIVWFVARRPLGAITALGERVWNRLVAPLRGLAPRGA